MLSKKSINVTGVQVTCGCSKKPYSKPNWKQLGDLRTLTLGSSKFSFLESYDSQYP